MDTSGRPRHSNPDGADRVDALFRKMTTADLLDLRAALEHDMDRAVQQERANAEDTIAFCTDRIATIDHILKERDDD